MGDDLAAVPLLQLGDTVGATGEDEDDGDRQAGKEGLEAPAKSGHAARAPVAEHVVGEGRDEDGDDDDLEDQAGHGNVDADAITGLGSGQGAASGLEDETDDIGGDEDPVEQLRLESRKFGGEVYDGLGKGDVDGGREKDGGDGEADYVNWVSSRGVVAGFKTPRI